MIAKSVKSLIKPLIPAKVRLKLREAQQRFSAVPKTFRERLELRRIQKLNQKNFSKDIKNNTVQLHLGCGDEYLPGYINVDFFNKTRADRRWKLNNLKLPDGCCSRVESYAVFEHLNYVEFYETLEECHRVLAPGGVLAFEIPEFEEFIRLWLLQDPATRWSFDWFSAIWGGQWNDGQYHKAGYSYDRVRGILEQVGFRQVRRAEPKKTYPPCVMQRVESIKVDLSSTERILKLETLSKQFEVWGHHAKANELRRQLKKLDRPE